MVSCTWSCLSKTAVDQINNVCLSSNKQPMCLSVCQEFLCACTFCFFLQRAQKILGPFVVTRWSIIHDMHALPKGRKVGGTLSLPPWHHSFFKYFIIVVTVSCCKKNKNISKRNDYTSVQKKRRQPLSTKMHRGPRELLVVSSLPGWNWYTWHVAQQADPLLAKAAIHLTTAPTISRYRLDYIQNPKKVSITEVLLAPPGTKKKIVCLHRHHQSTLTHLSAGVRSTQHTHTRVVNHNSPLSHHNA